MTTEIAFYRDSDKGENEGTRCASKLVKMVGTDRIVISPTPFYAESGGQIGDRGTIKGKNFEFQVEDTQKNGDTIVQYGKLVEGDLSKLPKKVTAEVDYDNRKRLMANHSATHILQYALRQVIGEDYEATRVVCRSRSTSFRLLEPERTYR